MPEIDYLRIVLFMMGALFGYTAYRILKHSKVISQSRWWPVGAFWYILLSISAVQCFFAAFDGVDIANCVKYLIT